jgi:23S rRNA (cytosine1962-C5)-methyltransferase
VGEGEFLEMMSSAAADAGRRVRILEKRGAAVDHPALLNMPETAYLKCVICQVGL